jgi:hypothetical protein
MCYCNGIDSGLTCPECGRATCGVCIQKYARCSDCEADATIAWNGALVGSAHVEQTNQKWTDAEAAAALAFNAEQERLAGLYRVPVTKCIGAFNADFAGDCNADEGVADERDRR